MPTAEGLTSLLIYFVFLNNLTNKNNFSLNYLFQKQRVSGREMKRELCYLLIDTPNSHKDYFKSQKPRAAYWFSTRVGGAQEFGSTSTDFTGALKEAGTAGTKVTLYEGMAALTSFSCLTASQCQHFR